MIDQSDYWTNPETRRKVDAEITRQIEAERQAMLADAAAGHPEFKADLRRRGWDEGRIAAWEARGFAATRTITGAEEDIEANYPGGLAAFRRANPDTNWTDFGLAVEDGQITGAMPPD